MIWKEVCYKKAVYLLKKARSPQGITSDWVSFDYIYFFGQIYIMETNHPSDKLSVRRIIRLSKN